MAGAVQWPYYSSGNVAKAASNEQNGSVMGKDQFLKILITQLQNQDPAAPMQDREFIAQMAQFSSLEQMMNMTKEIHGLRQSLGIASGMIGLEVSWLTYDENGEAVGEGSGIVDAIVIKDDKQYAEIDGEQIDIDDIFAMKTRSPEEST
ncbi:flagellar hook capping FlgD N-terminal domain-containing protein [Paenibacillus sp.]|uniref:flagellar hook capping FlgD N-terminal domain-containing protein n=1 Tax=Paenibacillus sp. TaxID=58172 RepID=UPI002D50D377|nr:flagellar hook capping FlgD N-terminal domain-containing protein [Paenibacillus sp.]HZG57886.1 flagellar hook capping FlgD N-terminal domain-containing protein [Paenibacillus sp.]